MQHSKHILNALVLGAALEPRNSAETVTASKAESIEEIFFRFGKKSFLDLILLLKVFLQQFVSCICSFRLLMLQLFDAYFCFPFKLNLHTDNDRSLIYKSNLNMHDYMLVNIIKEKSYKIKNPFSKRLELFLFPHIIKHVKYVRTETRFSPLFPNA